MARNRQLALEARRVLCDTLGIAPPCPDDMVGSLASVPLPDGPTTDIAWRQPDPIQRALYDGWGIEVPIHSWPAAPKRLVRISAQLYNSMPQYARLADALAKLLAEQHGVR